MHSQDELRRICMGFLQDQAAFLLSLFFAMSLTPLYCRRWGTPSKQPDKCKTALCPFSVSRWPVAEPQPTPNHLSTLPDSSCPSLYICECFSYRIPASRLECSQSGDSLQRTQEHLCNRESQLSSSKQHCLSASVELLLRGYRRLFQDGNRIP